MSPAEVEAVSIYSVSPFGSRGLVSSVFPVAVPRCYLAETAVSVSVVNNSSCDTLSVWLRFRLWVVLLIVREEKRGKNSYSGRKRGDRLAVPLSVDQQLQCLDNVGIFVPVFVPDIGNGYGSALRCSSVFDEYQIAVVGYFETFVYIVAVEVDVFRNPPRYCFHIRAEFRQIIAVFTVYYRNHIVYWLRNRTS